MNKLTIKIKKQNIMGSKKIRKQRNLNIEENYKIENNHYRDCEL